MQSTIHLLSRPILGLYPFRNICHSFACLRVNSHLWGYSFVMDHLAECLRNGQTGKRIKFFFFTWYRLEDTLFVVAVSCLRTYLSIWNVFKETERGLDDPVLLIHLFPLFFKTVDSTPTAKIHQGTIGNPIVHPLHDHPHRNGWIIVSLGDTQ